MLGVPIINYEGYEADDVIGTIARRGAEHGYDIVIVTGDKDFFQLVGDHIRVFNPRDDGTWYDAEGVKEKFGVRPDQVVDVLALMGDTIDNVKGVPGIGEKGARDLITTWGTLDALLEHAAEVPGKKQREALLAHNAEAHASRELLVIHTEVPVPFDIDAMRFRGPTRDAAYALFSELAFRSLTMEYAPTADTIEKDYRLVTDAAALAEVVGEIRTAGRMAMRILQDQQAAVRAGIVGIALSTGSANSTLPPAAPHRHAHRAATDGSGGDRRSQAGARRRGRREDRPRPESGRHRPRAAGCHAARHRQGHDARELSARRHTLRASA